MASAGAGSPFSLSLDLRHPVHRRLFDAARPLLERALGLHALNEMYAGLEAGPAGASFADRALAALDVHYEVGDADRAALPASGPLIVVANHPFGAVDGLVLTSLLGRTRNDLRLVVNFLLNLIPDLRPLFFAVDPFGSRGSERRNASALRGSVKWVRHGGALAVFPAGEVSHVRLDSRSVTDPPWSPTVGWLVHKTAASVVPVYFEGANSTTFLLAGLLHPRLRTALLPRELLRKRGATVRAHVGSVIPYERLARFDSPAALTDYLRQRTYLLENRAPVAGKLPAPTGRRRFRIVRPFAAAEPPTALADEIEALARDRRLVASGQFAVYHAGAAEIPVVLREIGRLREVAFRGVGEGTGKARDLDRFDTQYRHLFVWHPERREIVGGYRMGAVDEILPRFGPAGLYTTTLFRFKPRLLDQLAGGLELGRSFVRQEYQRDYAPLMLLWKAIGRFVVERPRYRMLFGPVSISNEYQSLSKYLMMMFLESTRARPSLSGLIEPRRSPRLPLFRDWHPDRASTLVRDLDEVDELLREIESDQRTVPTLLRQYLKLNAKLLGFSVDPDFSDVLDGLMLVDLIDVDRTILNRYMGRQGAEQYLAYHGTGRTEAIVQAQGLRLKA